MQSKPMEKACVLIPAYNESRTIKEIIKRIVGFGLDVVVVDDGSNDMTSRLATEAGAFVIRHERNKGKGASIREGIRYILSKPYSTVIVMDGDGQHNPDEIHRFLQMANEKGSAFIIGNRMDKPTLMPLIRFITNKVMSVIISIICIQDIPDTQCGYKFIKREVLEKLNLASSRYDIESEILIEAARAGTKIDSMHIKSIYRKEESKIKPLIDTLIFIRLLINTALGKNKE